VLVYFITLFIDHLIVLLIIISFHLFFIYFSFIFYLFIIYFLFILNSDTFILYSHTRFFFFKH